MKNLQKNWQKTIKLGDYENISEEYGKAAKKMAKNYEEIAKEITEKSKEMADEIEKEYDDTGSDFKLTMENGESVKKINELSVTAALKSLGSDNNFAVLSKNDFFI